MAAALIVEVTPTPAWPPEQLAAEPTARSPKPALDLATPWLGGERMESTGAELKMSARPASANDSTAMVPLLVKLPLTRMTTPLGTVSVTPEFTVKSANWRFCSAGPVPVDQLVLVDAVNEPADASP
jgi:hypothetical protein